MKGYKLGKYRHYLEVGFTDVCTGYRYTYSLNPDGTTETEPIEKPVYLNVKCRLSFPKIEVPQTNVDNVPVKFNPKVFLTVDTPCQVGDRVVIDRLDDNGNIIATYKGTLGEPSVFVTHKECLFAVRDEA